MVGCIILLIETARVPMGTIAHFAKPLVKLKADIKKVRIILFIFIFSLSVYSFHKEFEYRGQWLIWMETWGIFVIYVMILYKFIKVIFISSTPYIAGPNNIHLPSIKSTRSIAIIVSLSFAYFLSVLIAMIIVN